MLYHLLLLLLLSPASADHDASSSSSIIFTTLGRPDYAFDIFTLPTSTSSSAHELQLTDGVSVNFNGHFLSSPPAPTKAPNSSIHLLYVTERNGTSNIFYDALHTRLDRVQVPLLSPSSGKTVISMKDRPSLAGGHNLVYISTHENSGVPRTSWTAVYSTDLRSGLTKRLTPRGVADYSPSVSPSGAWTAVASYGTTGWSGEIEELATDIYVFSTQDGSRRVKVVEHGGWPCWIDDSTIYFHRRGSDGWWSIYRAILPSPISAISISGESVVVERVTPPGLHAFTPATSPWNYDFIAVATRRRDSGYRHIELFDLVRSEFRDVTRRVSPEAHHLNPFLSPDSGRVGYHKCRGGRNGQGQGQLFMENLQIGDEPNLSIFRIEGSFPSFSPAGDRIAYVEFPGVYVVDRDGSNRKQVYPETAFSTAWDPVRPGVVYTSTGPTFAPESAEVDVIAVNVDRPGHKKLTTNGLNNAFPSPSPNGKWIVFRSSRSGHKNLYIMDAENGESVSLRRLTSGPWTDTMCNWSPEGDLIAFASDRERPGTGSFELYVVRPDGTGVRKLVQSGSAGRANHPWFSPDGKSLVFTSDYSAVSAEPISNMHHFQPYGEIYTVKLDGSDLKRLTHNSFEDGTPTWGPTYIKPVDIKESVDYGKYCSFEDLHWLDDMPNDNVSMITAHFVSATTTSLKCGI